ncbi:MAG TPA: bifunctional UDP-N-acetylglucosamine diphosphorylase/glucosamine-1-phosphate N-acetyltransferase GlmU [Anaerolineaceae bacterium]|nr:bifunctional UDP-N-acetylglucosamine diphosphorylase/glucosamine-1-phosphate N-acetyltransferase GlmU [Anaerolineaceae bacterium]
MRIASVILAAGMGKRMNSALPKVLHALAGKAMIAYSIQAAMEVSDVPPVVVIGHGGELVQQFVGDSGRCVVQQPQLGTAHALMTAQPVLQGQADLVVVTTADMPLLTGKTLRRLVEAQKAHPGPFTMLTLVNDHPHGFGRIVRAPDGSVQAIVEEAQATPEQLQIDELNASVYCFRADWLWPALQRIQLSPKGEYYLTDTVAVAVQDGLAVQAISIPDPSEAMGVNNRIHLAEAESILRRRINEELMLAGVTFIDPASTYIQPGVQIGRDTVIYPNTHLRGGTVIGQDCQIGPNTIIEDTRIGDRCTILSSVLEGALVEDEVSMGPFGHLRKGAHLGRGVHMGNFGEVKSSYLGPGTKMGHFSYIGDAQIGEDVNIGAGTITCNFDGEHKHKTRIGDHVFIGSDTMLVAPLEIGDGARTGAGSVVTHDVDPGDVVVGVPARPFRKKSGNG